MLMAIKRNDVFYRLTSTAASIASASVPSAALVLMLIVLTAIDAPVRDVSLLWAIDWFVDRCRTTNNMLGDAYAAAVVQALSSKELAAMDKLHAKEVDLDSVKVSPEPLIPKQKYKIIRSYKFWTGM